jgi:hypothetical protein
MNSNAFSIFLAALMFVAAGEPVAAEGDAQKAILITGASTGIGRNMAETLAAAGHFVYAGARKQSDLDALSAIDNIQGIRLSVIEPGNYNSAIVGTKLRRMAERGQTADGSLYVDEIESLLERPADRSIYKEPDEVSAALMHAMFDENPKRRYMVVPNKPAAEITIKQMITELVQLNEGQEYTYDRAALIAMLDEALAEASD